MKNICCFLTFVIWCVCNKNGVVGVFQQQLSCTSLLGNCNKPQSLSLRTRIAPFTAMMTPEEERAAALSDYLAKAHEEKLRVIKEVEQKKNQEIDQLKQQIEELKSSSSSASAVVMVNGADAIAVKAFDDMNKEELTAKILQYQNFMRQYMIDAQEQKYRAVLDAQITAQNKLSESLSLLGLLPSSAVGTSDNTVLSLSSSSSSTTETPLYTARNSAVAKAAAAGKSRWGPMEVERVTSNGRNNIISLATSSINGASSTTTAAATAMAVNGASAPEMKTVASTSVVVPVPAEVAEADHGLRSDGSVGGLTLAERVYFGSTAAAAATTGYAVAGSSITPSTTTVSTNPIEVLYHQRNINIVQAAKAGKSNRWGSQEVDRVSSIVAATGGQAIPTTTVPSSSSQRVNFGASILGQQ